MNENINNRQKIMDVALQLFSEKGYEAVGVQAIAEQSGITKPTLYYYFGNKEGIFRELLNSHYSQLNNLIQKSATYKPNPASYFDDVYPVLIAVTKTYFKFATKNETFYRMALAGLFSPPTSQTLLIIREFNTKQYSIITEMFTQIAEVHPNMKDKEKRLCWTFIGMINNYIGLWYNGVEDLTDETTKESVRQFMHGIFN